MCDFVWVDSELTVSEEEMADIFASGLAGYELARGAASSRSKQLAPSLGQPTRPREPFRHKWLLFFLVSWFVVLYLVLASSPVVGYRDAIIVSLVDSAILSFFVYGMAGLRRPGRASKAFGIVLVLLLIGVAYESQPWSANFNSGSVGGLFSIKHLTSTMRGPPVRQ